MNQAVKKEAPWDGQQEGKPAGGVMSWSPEERRKMPDPSLMALQLNTMQKDIGAVKESVDKLTEAIARMALIEERQSNTQSDTNLVFEKYDRLESRVHALEVSVPLVTAQSNQSSKWISHALTGLAVAALMFVAFQTGLVPQ